ncbi:MAG: hypothetical protein KZQ83_17700 [gamma proteobacterium symbiont of Taylorina sp.]|nr:hypothetical protein [gamma proteobacterium symbiont of Taylorina sp.]
MKHIFNFDGKPIEVQVDEDGNVLPNQTWEVGDSSGKVRVISEDELDLMELEQQFGADKDDPISIAFAKGKKEITDQNNIEKAKSAIERLDKMSAYERKINKPKVSGEKGGKKKKGHKIWHVRAMIVIIKYLNKEPAERTAKYIVEAMNDRFNEEKEIEEVVERIKVEGNDLVNIKFINMGTYFVLENGKKEKIIDNNFINNTLKNHFKK